MPQDTCRADHPKRLCVSNPYVRGRGFEYRIMNVLKKKGCLCFRRYASKGVFDIVAVAPITAEDKRPMVIQAKRKDYIDKEEMARILELGRTLAARTIVATRDEKNNIIFREYQV